MKNLKYIMATLMVAAIVAVVLVGCKKEKETISPNDNTPTSSSVVQRLLDFQQQVKYYTANPYIKDGEAMETDEAVNDIVDLFNAVYSEPDAYYEQIARHEFSLTIPVTSEGKVLASDAAALYNQAVSMAAEAYHNDGIVENKGYTLLTATVEPQRGGTARVNFSGTSGRIDSSPSPVSMPFGSLDNWQYKAPLGKCDSTCMYSGADKELEYYIKAAAESVYPTAPQGYEYRPIAPTTLTFSGLEYMDSIWADTIFCRPVEYGKCIEWTDMNRYYQGEWYMIFNKIPSDRHYSIGNLHYVMPDITIQGMEQYDPSHSHFYYYHETTVTYCRLELFDIYTFPHQPLEK